MKERKVLREYPKSELPREKMLAHGPGALGDDELLAIFLRTGIPGENAIAIGRRLLEDYQGLPGMAQTDLNILKEERGLGPAKACQLVAAFELGRRLSTRQLDRKPLDSAQAIYDAFAPQMRHRPTETLRVAVVDSQMRCHSVHEISSGSSTATISCIRDIIRPVLLTGNHNFIVLHNHPSGNPRPSTADIEVTKNIEEAAEILDLRLIDHLIIGHPSNDSEPYYSFFNNGQLKTSR